jgi:hypothetical protein
MILHTLLPAGRAEIIRCLFLDPTRELYVRELARATTLALRTVQKELATLSAIRLVLSRSNGYQRFYRANRRHAAFRALQQLVIKDQAASAFVRRHKRPRRSRERISRKRTGSR